MRRRARAEHCYYMRWEMTGLWLGVDLLQTRTQTHSTAVPESNAQLFWHWDLDTILRILYTEASVTGSTYKLYLVTEYKIMYKVHTHMYIQKYRWWTHYGTSGQKAALGPIFLGPKVC